MPPLPPTTRVVFRLLATAAALILTANCAGPSKTAPVQPPPSAGVWTGYGIAGAPRLVINLNQQRILYFKGGRLVGISPISSGRESHATATGIYRISEKDINHRSSIYGNYVGPDGSIVQSDVDVRSDPVPPGARFVGAGMRYFMRVTGAIGMHEGYLPGYPASHGCIRLPTRMAAIFFHETPLGTPVEITGTALAAAPQPVIPVGAHAPVPPTPPPAPKPERRWFTRNKREEAPAQAATATAQPPATPAETEAGKRRFSMAWAKPDKPTKPASPPRKPAATKSSGFGPFKKAPKDPRGTTLYWNG